MVFTAATVDLAVTARRETTVMHVDEPPMLNRGFLAPHLYAEVLDTRAVGPLWSGALWQPRKPPLGKLLIALGLRLGGAERPAELYDYWPGRPDSLNRVPTPEVLHAGRLLVPLCAAGATTLVFVLGADVAGLTGGLAAALLFQANPVVRMYGPRALADLPMVAVALLALWYLVRRVAPAWEGPLPRLARRALGLGVLVGTATAIKQNGALVGCVAAVLFLLWTAVILGRGAGRAFARGGCAAMLAASAALSVYVAVDPHLWPAPLAGMRGQVEEWDQRFAMHRRRRPDTALVTSAERVAAVARSLAGGPLTTLPTTWVTGVLVLAGVIALARGASAGGVYSPAAVLLAWGAVTTALVALWLPLDWERYHLPLVTVVAVFGGASAAWLPAQLRPFAA
jgi:hypothetical protein